MCNVFDEYSIVANYILWPCKNDYYGDAVTQVSKQAKRPKILRKCIFFYFYCSTCTFQALTAGLLFKLAQLEEGRRYLNYSSKVTNDIKKVIKKRSSFLEYDTIESLNATLNLLNPPLTQNVNVTYYCKPIDEGKQNKFIAPKGPSLVSKSVNTLLKSNSK